MFSGRPSLTPTKPAPNPRQARTKHAPGPHETHFNPSLTPTKPAQTRAKPAPSPRQTCAWPTRNALQSFAHTNQTRPNPHSNPLVFQEASSETFVLTSARLSIHDTKYKDRAARGSRPPSVNSFRILKEGGRDVVEKKYCLFSHLFVITTIGYTYGCYL